MAISADYPVPVYVNGYACNNCAQVAEAKRGVDPADPKAGPYGIDAATAQAGAGGSAPASLQRPAVTFGGVLAGASPGAGATPLPNPPSIPPASGGLLNISV